MSFEIEPDPEDEYAYVLLDADYFEDHEDSAAVIAEIKQKLKWSTKLWNICSSVFWPAGLTPAHLDRFSRGQGLADAIESSQGAALRCGA